MLIRIDSQFVPLRERIEYFIKNDIVDLDLNRVSKEDIDSYLYNVESAMEQRKGICSFDITALGLLLRALESIPKYSKDVNILIEKIRNLFDKDEEYEKCLCSDELRGRDK